MLRSGTGAPEARRALAAAEGSVRDALAVLASPLAAPPEH
jgi:hypothetical protein